MRLKASGEVAPCQVALLSKSAVSGRVSVPGNPLRDGTGIYVESAPTSIVAHCWLLALSLTARAVSGLGARPVGGCRRDSFCRDSDPGTSRGGSTGRGSRRRLGPLHGS